MAQRGFTLIELCITTTLAGLLTALGVASYRTVLLRAHRSEARIALLDIQAAQERHYLNALRYSPELEKTHSPGARYRLSIETDDAGQRYTARAVPSPDSSQAADTACTEFTLRESGQRGGSSPECWP
ncbi:MAG: hypothetical protein RLZZ200_794 [Pseudomonadota bacterium]|jgi:type IV pilus assembly protein PilE